MTDHEIELPSNRKFGFFFSAVFAVVFAFFFYHGSTLWYAIFGVLAVVTLAVTLIDADKLLIFNKGWMKLGLLLAMIISPIVLGIIFFILITPVAVGTRLFGRDELRLKMVNRESHWKVRDPVGPEPKTFKNQF